MNKAAEDYKGADLELDIEGDEPEELEKTTKVTLTVDMEIPTCMIDNFAGLKDELVGEIVKVKSGVYENAAIGWVSSIVVPQ